MPKQVGVFGGTFDPIHHGHLHLAVELSEARSLDEVWFVPAWISPHKQMTAPTAAVHRLEMARLAVQAYPNFRVLDLEIQRQGASYTVETLRQLKKDFPCVDFSLILGGDCVGSLARWKAAEELPHLASLIIGARKPEGVDWEALPEGGLREAVRSGITPIPILDIEATRLRKRLSMQQCCHHLIPSKVLDYIVSNDLYLVD